MPQKKSILKRETIGRGSSNKKMLGDALSTVATGAATGLFAATRTGSGAIFWPIGFIALGTIGMVESQPGTYLESGSAGMLGANSVVALGRLFGLIK